MTGSFFVPGPAKLGESRTYILKMDKFYPFIIKAQDPNVNP